MSGDDEVRDAQIWRALFAIARRVRERGNTWTTWIVDAR